MKQQNWVLVAFLHQLFTGVLQQQAVAVVERITHLESINGISSFLLGEFENLRRKKSVLVHTIVIFYSLAEVHFLT